MTHQNSTFILIVITLCSLANAKNQWQFGTIPFDFERNIKRKVSSTKKVSTKFPSTKPPHSKKGKGKGKENVEGKGKGKGKGKGNKGDEKSTKPPNKKGKGSTKSPDKSKSNKGKIDGAKGNGDTIGSANRSDGYSVHLTVCCLFATILVTFHSYY